MATNMKKLTPSAIMERAEGDGGFEVGHQHHSKLLVEQTPHNIRESQGRDGAEVDTLVNVISQDIRPDTETTLSTVSGHLDGERVKVSAVEELKEEVTPKQVELEYRASDLEELNDYFTALEQNHRNLQQLLQEKSEEHAVELRALERERVQERAEWERERTEREEALMSALMSTAVSRQKLMKELRSQPATLVSTKRLDGAALSRKHQRHQASTDGAPQDAPSSSACRDMGADQLDLEQLMELEKKVREAEKRKQQKALARAEKKARKAERRKRTQKNTQKKDDQVILAVLHFNDVLCHFTC